MGRSGVERCFGYSYPELHWNCYRVADMKAAWPGTPGGYEPYAWKDLVKEASARVRLRENHKRQEHFSNLKEAKDKKK